MKKRGMWPYVVAEISCVVLVLGVLTGGIVMLYEKMTGGGFLIGFSLFVIACGKWGVAEMPKHDADKSKEKEQ